MSGFANDAIAEAVHWGPGSGQFDLQDGVATSQAWIDTLQWPGRRAFWGADRRVWRLPVSNGTVRGLCMPISKATTCRDLKRFIRPRLCIEDDPVTCTCPV